MQGVLLEQDLDITRPAFRKRLVRSMKWKLWGMGEEPKAPEGFRATNATCGALSLEWDRSEGEADLSFPVHKFVLRRAPLEQQQPQGDVTPAAVGTWNTVMQGPHRGFFDSQVKPGASYRYSLQAWNALGHSDTVEIDALAATEDCMERGFWGWLDGGRGILGGFDYVWGVIVAVVVSTLGAIYIMVGVWFGGGSAFGGKKRNGAYDAGYDAAGVDSAGRRYSGNDLVHMFSNNGGRGESGSGQEGGAGALAAAAATSSATSGVAESPMSNASKGGTCSDREMKQQQSDTERRRMSSSSIVMKPSIASSSRKILRTRSVPVRKHLTGRNTGFAVVPGTLPTDGERWSKGSGVGGVQGSGGLDPRPEVSVAVESMRKEAARRLMTRQSTSKDDKEVCEICGREFKW